jgi:hypothetical protein
MPLQNRVTPFGELIAVPERGTMYGNRGVLHNAQRQIVRSHQVRRWIICALEFRGRHRTPMMQPNRYTELFFLDEATALAAGHRPCAECRYRDYQHYRRCWTIAHGGSLDALPSAERMDQHLHTDRVTAPGVRRTYDVEIDTLPDGVFIVRDGEPWLLQDSALLHWTPGGYDTREPRPERGQVTVLTPRGTVGAIAAGYLPGVHSSAVSSDDMNQSGTGDFAISSVPD